LLYSTDRPISDDQRYKQPEGFDVAVTIVFPTIFACIILVAAMLFGIKKCKEWELDRIIEMRKIQLLTYVLCRCLIFEFLNNPSIFLGRTRRLIQRMTQVLREKNFRTLQGTYYHEISL